MSTHDSTSEWECVPYDEAIAESLASALDLPLALSKVLVGRGICTEADAQAFLQPTLSQLTDPFLLPGVADGINRVLDAIEKREKIIIYGDYDCDGVVSTALLLEILGQLGAEVGHFIPKRAEDGYGFTLGSLDQVLDDLKPQLIVTADCGMRSVEAVKKASRSGVDVIIIDHHRPYGAPQPDAVAVISTLDDDLPESMQSFSAVGLAFTFCRALLGAAKAAGVNGSDAIDLWQYLDLVTIGTVTDLMPLIGDNRILVSFGLQLLNEVQKRRPGVLALVRAAGLRTEIGSYEVGFLVGPRLSSAGRVGHAQIALDLLLESDAMEARRKSGRLEACYRERRRIEESVLQDAIAAADASIKRETGAIIAIGSGWHIGTLGIVAARICGRYNRPAVVITRDEKSGLARGSCRSVAGVDLEGVLTQCADHLHSYGGHGLVAGFSLSEKEIPVFSKRFDDACQKKMAVQASIAEQYQIDAWIPFAEADDQLLDSIKLLQPLGIGNQTPVWGVHQVRLQGPSKIVGGNHLKCTLVSGGTQRDAIGYGLGDGKLPDEPWDVAFQLQRNHYRGASMLQLSIKAFRSSIG